MNNLPAACSFISRRAAGTIDGLTATNTTSAFRTTVALSVVEMAPRFYAREREQKTIFFNNHTELNSGFLKVEQTRYTLNKSNEALSAGWQLDVICSPLVRPTNCNENYYNSIHNQPRKPLQTTVECVFGISVGVPAAINPLAMACAIFPPPMKPIFDVALSILRLLCFLFTMRFKDNKNRVRMYRFVDYFGRSFVVRNRFSTRLQFKSI